MTATLKVPKVRFKEYVMSLATSASIEADIAALRSMTTDDSPAGPLFLSDYAESDLTSNDPFLNCSLSTGSKNIPCCA
jgi:hypothetical protein